MQEVAARAALDRVAGERERRAGKTDQRDVCRQIGPRLADGFHHEVKRVGAFELDDAIDVGRFAHRVVNLRAFALGEFKVHAHRLENRQQIGKHDRRVDAEQLNSRAHDLAAKLRIAAELEKTMLLRECGDTPACIGRLAA